MQLNGAGEREGFTPFAPDLSWATGALCREWSVPADLYSGTGVLCRERVGAGRPPLVGGSGLCADRAVVRASGRILYAERGRGGRVLCCRLRRRIRARGCLFAV